MPVALEGFVALGDDGDLALLARRGGPVRVAPHGHDAHHGVEARPPAEPGFTAASWLIVKV